MNERARANRQWLNTWGVVARLWFFGSVSAGLVAALATVVQLGLMAWVIHAVVADAVGQVSHLTAPLVGLLLAIVIRALAQALQDVSGANAARCIRQKIRAALLAQWAQQGPVRLAGESSAVLASEWVEQVDALEGYFARFQPQLWLSVLVPLLVVSVVFVLDWLAAIFLLAAAPLIPIFMILVGMGAERLNQKHFASTSRLAGHFLDRVRGLTTLQLFGQSDAAVQSVAAAADEYRRLNLGTLRVAFLSSAVLEFFASVAIAVVAIYVGFGLLGYIDFGPAGELSLFSGLLVLLLAPEFFQPLRTLSHHYHDRATALGAADHLRKRFQDSPADTDSVPVPQRTPDSDFAGIVVESLTVTYPGRGAVFKGLGFRLPAGQSLVLNGPSGSGKSSVLNVLAGFYRSTEGAVSIFGQPPGTQPVAWLNQRPFLIQGSWADNLRVAAPSATPAAMKQALDRVGLTTILTQQPQGLDTPLGEGGRGLSVGQGHRLALARIFLTPTRLVLLDEPTEGLDPYSRQEVIAALRRVARTGVTLIIASHQPELSAMADHRLTLPVWSASDA